jgi:fucose permease
MAQSSMTWSSNSPFVRDRFTWLAYLMLAYFAYLQAALGPLMPFLRAELNLNYTLAGLHFSAFALGMVLAGVSGDRLARRWGRWIVFWGGAGGMAAGALCLVLGSRVAITVAGAFIMGWLGAFLLVMIQAGLADRHAEARAVALTESNLGASISAGLSPVVVGGFQRLGLGWRGALVLAVLVLALVGARFLRVTIPDARQGSPRSGPAGRGLPLSFWAYWLVIILCVSVEWCLVFWGADFLQNSLGLSKVNAATAMSIFFLAMVLGRLSGSRLSRAVSSANLLLFALGVSLAGFPIFWLARCAPLNIAGLFVAGFGVANLFPLTLSVAVGLDPTQSNMASARVSLGAGLAILIAPLALGWTADQVDIQNAYGMVALLLILAIAVAVLARRWVTRDASSRVGS